MYQVGAIGMKIGRMFTAVGSFHSFLERTGANNIYVQIYDERMTKQLRLYQPVPQIW
jgi:hypothetical protein